MSSSDMHFGSFSSTNDVNETHAVASIFGLFCKIKRSIFKPSKTRMLSVDLLHMFSPISKYACMDFICFGGTAVYG